MPFDPPARFSTVMQRPPSYVRAMVLVLAITGLGLTMCHSVRRDVPAPANPSAPQAQQAPTQGVSASPAPTSLPAKPAQAAAPEPPERYFPATKAPGPLR